MAENQSNSPDSMISDYTPGIFHPNKLPSYFRFIVCNIMLINLFRLDKEEQPTNEDVTECRPEFHTIRSVFIINTEKRIRAILSYPMETGRSIDEIIRVIDSLQACDEHGHHIVTPANWQPVSDSILLSGDWRTKKGLRLILG